MNIAILGASAGVGLECVKLALRRGHKVITLSRSTDSLPQHPNLHSIQGNATNVADLKKALGAAEAVIVALGTGSSTKATTLYTDAAAALLQAQQELQNDIPFIVLTGFGAGHSAHHHGWLMKLFFRFVLKDIYQNKTAMEEMITRSNLKWEVVRPGVLTNKPLSEKYRVETEYYDGMKIGRIARSDVAHFLVREAENPTALGLYPALSNK